jgi:hypothetical protein
MLRQGLMHRSKRHHSITSSARSRIDVGNSIPIAFAVFYRLRYFKRA